MTFRGRLYRNPSQRGFGFYGTRKWAGNWYTGSAMDAIVCHFTDYESSGKLFSFFFLIPKLQDAKSLEVYRSHSFHRT